MTAEATKATEVPHQEETLTIQIGKEMHNQGSANMTMLNPLTGRMIKDQCQSANVPVRLNISSDGAVSVTLDDIPRAIYQCGALYERVDRNKVDRMTLLLQELQADIIKLTKNNLGVGPVLARNYSL